MLDQGSRTAFRGTTKAFAFDEEAKKLSLEIFAKNWFFEKYLPIERQIIIMPLLHSEDIAAHRLAGEYVLRLSEGAEDPEAAKLLQGTRYFLAEHSKVVEQFGRYPSRNASLVSAVSYMTYFISVPVHCSFYQTTLPAALYVRLTGAKEHTRRRSILELTRPA
jgi:uncharacterized protein (DUF924 family)